jgi:hypothetical protein
VSIGRDRALRLLVLFFAGVLAVIVAYRLLFAAG